MEVLGASDGLLAPAMHTVAQGWQSGGTGNPLAGNQLSQTESRSQEDNVGGSEGSQRRVNRSRNKQISHAFLHGHISGNDGGGGRLVQFLQMKPIEFKASINLT